MSDGSSVPGEGLSAAPGARVRTLLEVLDALAQEVGGEEAGAGTGPGVARPSGPAFQEPEGMALMEALGFQVPIWAAVAGPDDLPDLAGFPGERVVVKLLDPRVAHRTEVGGVRIVPREEPAVRAALGALAERASGSGVRYLVQEWIPHETGPGGELLLGYRWTHEFGPVVTLGLGGVDTEILSRAGRPGALQWIGAPGATLEAVAQALETRPLTALATGQTRGRAGRVTCRELAGAVLAFLELAEAGPARGIDSVEVNPLVFRSGRPVALDVLVRAGGVERTEVPREDRREEIGLLLRPSGIAVVGASARGVNPGRIILRNVVGAGFPRDRIQVVKEGCQELEGCRCVPEIAALEPVDALVVSVAADQVPPLLEEVTRKGLARSVILVSAGLGEGEGPSGGPGPGKAERTASPAEELQRVLELPGAPVVNGGNCLGIRSRPGGYDTLFLPPHKLGFPPRRGSPHPVALLTQSGAFAVARTSALPWLDPRYVVTVGNQVDLTVAEYLEAFLDDPEVRVVAAYVEGFRAGDGRRFLEAADRHRQAGRTVVLYRAGRTPQGADAMASHTASVAGDYAVTRALAEARGVLVAETVQEFQELTALAVRLDGREVGGRGAGFLSNAGFECVAMADAAGPLRPVALAAETREALEDLLESAGLGTLLAARNPLDVSPILGDEGFARAVEIVLGDPGVEVGVVGCVPMTPALRTLAPGEEHEEEVEDPEGVAARLGALWRGSRKAWVAVVDGGPRYEPFVQALEGHGIPVIRHGDRAVALLGRYVEARLAREAGAGAPPWAAQPS